MSIHSNVSVRLPLYLALSTLLRLAIARVSVSFRFECNLGFEALQTTSAKAVTVAT